MTTRIIVAFALSLTLAAARLLAHHTAAYTYDVEKAVPLNGTVTEVQWKQPHVIVHVDVKSDTGTVVSSVSWVVEMAGPRGGMYRRGVRLENFVKPSDEISMTACVAKDGSHSAAVHSITVPSSLQGKVGTC